MRFFLTLTMLIPMVMSSQNWYSEDNKNFNNLSEILTQSFFIEENKQEVIYIKIDDITSNFCVPLSNKLEVKSQSISFIREKELYESLIHNYYDIKYLDINYNIARIGYVQYSESKAVQLVFQKDIYGKWELLKKQITYPQLRYVDFLYKQIKKIKFNKN